MWFYYPLINDGVTSTEVTANNFPREVRQLPWNHIASTDFLKCDFGYFDNNGQEILLEQVRIDGGTSVTSRLSGAPISKDPLLGYCNLHSTNGTLRESSEFQLSFNNSQAQRRCAILYDLFPFREGKTGRLVSLLHKTWLGGGFESTVLIACPPLPTVVNVKYEIQVIGSDGVQVLSCTLMSSSGKANTISLKKMFLDAGERIPDQVTLFTTIITSNIASQVVLTLTQDGAGSMAMEHSLPPVYYFDASIEGMKIIRSRAFESFKSGVVK